MTTGGVVSGEGEGGRDEERGRGHRKMAVALSHILSSATEAERGQKGRRKEGESVRDKKTKKRKTQQQILPAVDSESENEGVSPSSDDDGDDVISTAGDVVASCRRLPDTSTLDYERRLQKIATTGVVQLFNAVSQHSKQVEAQVKAAGPSHRKKAKVLSTVDKGSFIDLLKGRRSEEKKWPVLKDDFMLKAKMRDWEREEEEEEEGGEERRERNSSSESGDE